MRTNIELKCATMNSFKLGIITCMILLGAWTSKSLAETAPFQDPRTVDGSYPPSLVEVSFDNDGARMSGLLYLADGAGPHPTAVLLHGYPGNEKNLDTAQAMRRVGYNVLFFHYRGAWGSEGQFSLTNAISDVGSALEMLRLRAADYRVDTDRLVLIGHSMGGFAGLHAAARDPQIKCVAGIAAADFGLLGEDFANDEKSAEGFAAYSDGLFMLAGWSGRKALAEIEENREQFSLQKLAPKLSGKSVLLVAGERDRSVPVDTVHTPLVAAYNAQGDIELEDHVLPGDHSFSWSRVALTRTVIEWADGCL